MRHKDLIGLVLALALIAGQAPAQTREDWTPITPPNAPEARHGHSMVTLPDGRVMLFGGEDVSGHLFNDLHTFDGAWNEVIPENDPPPARRDHQAWVRNQQMYVTGGFGESNLLDDTWRYDIENNEWHKLTHSGPRPSPRYNHGVATVGEATYIFGGTGEYNATLTDLWKFSPDGSYTLLDDASYSIIDPELQIAGDIMYVFGLPGVVAMYHFGYQEWGTNSGPPVGSGCSTTLAQNAQGEPVVLLIGGQDSEGQESAEVYEYNTATGELTQREALPHTWTNGAGSKYDPGGKFRSDNFRVVLFGGRVNGEISNATLVSTSDLIGVDDPAQPPAYSLRLSPNPASGRLHLTAEDPVKGIRIYDMEGRLLVSREYHSHEVTLDLSTLETGVYIIRTTAGEAVVTRRLMVKK
ncbi:MAG: T9SS type A sorting domain-containing protein [Bacteroidales bacterium]|nr:T9SS type A sorting domain-containing protein [Bacteroidales bacterium]